MRERESAQEADMEKIGSTGKQPNENKLEAKDNVRLLDINTYNYCSRIRWDLSFLINETIDLIVCRN